MVYPPCGADIYNVRDAHTFKWCYALLSDMFSFYKSIFKCTAHIFWAHQKHQSSPVFAATAFYATIFFHQVDFFGKVCTVPLPLFSWIQVFCKLSFVSKYTLSKWTEECLREGAAVETSLNVDVKTDLGWKITLRFFGTHEEREEWNYYHGYVLYCA